MAIIYSYPEIPSLEDRDLLLISDLSSEKNLTKRVELGELTAYINSSNTFTFTQGSPATVWNVQHDLEKFPSVSVINNNNIVVYGQVEYINKNRLTITFSAALTGKAYLN